MKAKVINSPEEWHIYCRSFSIAGDCHGPRVPPSFPVLVISETRLVKDPQPNHIRWEAEHAFIELPDLKRMLGL